MVLYTREQHGGLPVYVRDGAFCLELPAPLPPTYFVRPVDLMSAVTGTRGGQSFRRYFALDRRDPALGIPDGGSALDLFGMPIPVMPGPVVIPAPKVRTVRAQRPVRPESVTEPQLGIDLEVRGHEVRKILFAGFGSRIARMGIDPEDVLQDVFRGLLARNRGRCPFDARKSSFGHYVHLVSECILNNMHRKHTRQRQHEQIGIRLTRSKDAGDFGGTTDAALEAENRASPVDVAPEQNIELEQALARLPDEQTREVARLLADGHGRREIAGMLSVSQRVVDQAVRTAREVLLPHR